MSDWEELETYRGCKILVASEEYIDDGPRDWDNVGHMVCFHSRYDFGDKKLEDENTPEKLIKRVKRKDIVVCLPLYVYEHGGVTMNTSGYSHMDSMRWDWGQTGYIFVTKEKVRKEFMCKRVSKKARKWAEQALLSEVKTYAMYLEGDIVQWKTVDEDGNMIDSVGGYYGYFESRDHLLEDARASINGNLDPMLAQYGEMLLQ